MIGYLGKAFDFASKYSDDVVRLTSGNNIKNILSGLGVATGVASVGSTTYSMSQGQAEGGIVDLFTGFLDLSQDDYRADGGDQSGSSMRDCGKLIQNAAIGAFNVAVSCGVLKGVSKPLLSKVVTGVMAWQGASLADEFIRSDHDGVGDTVDKVSGGLSVINLAHTLSKLKP